MAIEDTLARAAADIERGDVGMARRRLSSLRAAYPDDFVVRRALRDTCRAGGDLAEAGRWGYVLEDASPEEVAAFERSRGTHPREIARSLEWPPQLAAEGDHGQARITALQTALRALPRPDPRGNGPWDAVGTRAAPDPTDVGCFLSVAAAITLLVLGAYQLFQILSGWFG